VSNGSNGALAHSAEAIDHRCMVRGVLVDVVDGDIEVLYRRHTADWLCIIPLDGDPDEVHYDPFNRLACKQYEIAIEPLI
jgi:hypothetical protein